jgi:hypothetical protein
MVSAQALQKLFLKLSLAYSVSGICTHCIVVSPHTAQVVDEVDEAFIARHDAFLEGHSMSASLFFGLADVGIPSVSTGSEVYMS